jgi:hypothetical protein
MEFIQQNIGNIIVGLIILGVVTFVICCFISSITRGKAGCGCSGGKKQKKPLSCHRQIEGANKLK